MPIIAPFSIPGGLAGLTRGLEEGWPAVEGRANHVLDLMATAPRQRTEPAVLLVQLLAYVTVLHATEPAPAVVPPLLLHGLAVVLGVEKHTHRTAVLSGALGNAEAAAKYGIDERTVRRWRAEGVGPPSAFGALELADRYARGGRSREGVPETLYDLAAAEVGSRNYFSTELLWALAEVLGVARRNAGRLSGRLTRGATEVLHDGLRDPEAFIAAGFADGSLLLERAGEGGAERLLDAWASQGLDDASEAEPAVSVNEVASKADVARDTVRRWKDKESPHAEAYELNRRSAAIWARFNASRKAQD